MRCFGRDSSGLSVAENPGNKPVFALWWAIIPKPRYCFKKAEQGLQGVFGLKLLTTIDAFVDPKMPRSITPLENLLRVCQRWGLLLQGWFQIPSSPSPPYPPSEFSSYPQQSDENHFFFLLSFLNFNKFKYFRGVEESLCSKGLGGVLEDENRDLPC